MIGALDRQLRCLPTVINLDVAKRGMPPFTPATELSQRSFGITTPIRLLAVVAETAFPSTNTTTQTLH